jgi:hypothetical protein
LAALFCYPLQPVPRERGGHPERIHIPFRLRELKEIKQDLGRFTDDSDQYIKAFITVIQTFELGWKDFMLLLNQTLTSLECKESLIRSLRQTIIITYKCLLLSPQH